MERSTRSSQNDDRVSQGELFPDVDRVGLREVVDAYQAIAVLTAQRAAVIAVIVATAGQYVEQRELARMAGGVGLGTVARTLRVLRHCGAISSAGGLFDRVRRRRSCQRHFLAPRQSPLAPTEEGVEQDSGVVMMAGLPIQRAPREDGSSALAGLFRGLGWNTERVRESEEIQPVENRGIGYDPSYLRRRERDRIRGLVTELGAGDGDAEARQLVGYAVLHRIDPGYVADRVAYWASEIRHSRGIRDRWRFAVRCIWNDVKGTAAA